MLESLEAGAGSRLDNFLRQAAVKYHTGIKKLVYKPGRSVREFLDPGLPAEIIGLDIFRSFDRHIRKYFSLNDFSWSIMPINEMPTDWPIQYDRQQFSNRQLLIGK